MFFIDQLLARAKTTIPKPTPTILAEKNCFKVVTAAAAAAAKLNAAANHSTQSTSTHSILQSRIQAVFYNQFASLSSLTSLSSSSSLIKLACPNVNRFRFFNHTMNENSGLSNRASAVSRLRIQSPPPPKTTNGDSNPISQVQKRKSRQRGFLHQLLCCFRPTSSSVCYKNNSHVRLSHSLDDQIYGQNVQNAKYSGGPLLAPKAKGDDRICMVIDLDETLVHSSFKPIDSADFIVPVEIDGTPHKVYVLKRPHVDEFLKKMGQLYECVLFTASLAKYADPVADLLDKEKIFKARLFRESCAFYRGNYVKDLSRLGRDLNRVIIVDNSPASYIFHPQNAVPVQSWFDDSHDSELLDLIPFLEGLSHVESVYSALDESRQQNR